MMSGVRTNASVNIYVNDEGLVVIDMEPFDQKLGRIVLTPDQARSISLHLRTYADEADEKKAGK